MRTLPTLKESLAAWRKGVGSLFPRVPGERGYHDVALFQPTTPPGHRAFSRFRFLLTLESVISLPGRDILDVAGGQCFVASALHFRGRRVTVNDLRSPEAALSVWGLEPEVRHFARNIFELQKEETGVFDVVLCAELIEHVAHPDQLLTHLRRFLRPGGHLVVTTPNGSFLGSRLPTLSEVPDHTVLEGRQYMPDADGHLMLMTPQELSDLFQRAGFEIVRTVLFGSPALRGYLKFHYLAHLKLPALCYMLEWVTHAAPAKIRAKLLSHMLMIGRATS
jgi:2-polyprenyl-6-hydroxyphenyl methylase/3-demethylubiquinone-9 3-methyltransferase